MKRKDRCHTCCWIEAFKELEALRPLCKKAGFRCADHVLPVPNRDQLEEELLDMLPVLGREHIGKLVDSLEVAVGDRAEEAGVVDLAKDLAELL